MVTWESKGGTAGGQQVALTADRAETIRRTVAAMRPWLSCTITPLAGYVPPGEDATPPAPAPERRPRRSAARTERPERRTRRRS